MKYLFISIFIILILYFAINRYFGQIESKNIIKDKTEQSKPESSSDLKKQFSKIQKLTIDHKKNIKIIGGEDQDLIEELLNEIEQLEIIINSKNKEIEKQKNLNEELNEQLSQYVSGQQPFEDVNDLAIVKENREKQFNFFQQNVNNRRKQRLLFFEGFDTDKMNADEYRTHQSFMDALYTSEELKKNIEEEESIKERFRMRKELNQEVSKIKSLMAEERTVLLGQYVGSLGLSEQQANDFINNIDGILKMTSFYNKK